VTWLAPRLPRQASTDQRESADRIDPALAAEATESTDAREPTEPIDKIEPAEPIDKMDPLEPIDRIDPLEPMLRMDPSVFRIGPFSQAAAANGRKVSAGPGHGQGGLIVTGLGGRRVPLLMAAAHQR
jgi:hypothetical protein